MELKFTLHADDVLIGQNIYRIRDKLILNPATAAAEDFLLSMRKWIVNTYPEYTEEDRRVVHDESLTHHTSKTTLQLLTRSAQESEQKALTHIRVLENRIRDLYRASAPLQKQLRATKRAAARLYRANEGNKNSTLIPTKYYRIHSLNSWGPSFSRVSYGTTAQEAVERFRRIYKVVNAMVHLEPITNPKTRK